MREQDTLNTMNFPDLVQATLLRRYQRFLADCKLPGGQVVTAHCPNTGSMRSCAEPGQPVLLSRGERPGRRLPWTWELYWSGMAWVCVHTQRPNAVAAEAIAGGIIPELASYGQLRREVRYGERERVDILLEDPHLPPAYVEVKSCTMLDADGVVRFPDAVSARALRHLQALEEVVRRGDRGVMLFLVGREDGCGFAPADTIDPAYGAALRRAREGGVEVLAYRTRTSPDSMVATVPETLLF